MKTGERTTVDHLPPIRGTAASVIGSGMNVTPGGSHRFGLWVVFWTVVIVGSAVLVLA
jgi:hypothetical protein